jgi:hemerythrin superfamily protein
MATVTKAIAKVAGLAKEAGTALSGYPGIFHHLAREHAQVAVLMQRVAASSEDSPVREELFPEIRTELLAHSKAEEREFYAPLARAASTKELVAKAREQHEKIRGYLDELAEANKATKTWLRTFERMVRAVQAHVDMEENQLFPPANELLDREQAAKINEAYEAAEEQEKKRLE